MAFKPDLPLEDGFYREAAQLVIADLETDELELYAMICLMVRYRLKGLNHNFIKESIIELKQATKIEIT